MGAGDILIPLFVILLVAALFVGGLKRTIKHIWLGVLVLGAGVAGTAATNGTTIYVGAMVAGGLLILFGFYRVFAEGRRSNP